MTLLYEGITGTGIKPELSLTITATQWPNNGWFSTAVEYPTLGREEKAVSQNYLNQVGRKRSQGRLSLSVSLRKRTVQQPFCWDMCSFSSQKKAALPLMQNVQFDKPPPNSSPPVALQELFLINLHPFMGNHPPPAQQLPPH